ncbi:MAG: hypothetical protein HGB19_02505, partial [Chlorobiales bacterium]|nr:hypothetical protein [Chlorobiales bacterium]
SENDSRPEKSAPPPDPAADVSNINIASACPQCKNYDEGRHFCALMGEPIPNDQAKANPCKGNTFNRKHYGGNRLAQLRSLRG